MAHELANLLDASLRNVGLVMSSLREPIVPSFASADEQASAASGGDEELIERLQSVNHAMQQMARLIQVMGRQSLPAGQAQIAPPRQPVFSVRDTIAHAVRLLSPLASQQGIDIHPQVSDDSATLPAGALYPVLINALRNSIEAIAHMPSRGPGMIVVTALVRDAELELSVADNGPGLDARVLDDERHFRFGVTTKPAGHGLGLALSRDIVQGLGGTLDIHTADSCGAVLTLRVPIETTQ